MTPEQREARLRELADWGVDLSLIQSSLARTPTERVQHMVGLLRIITEPIETDDTATLSTALWEASIWLAIAKPLTNAGGRSKSRHS